MSLVWTEDVALNFDFSVHWSCDFDWDSFEMTCEQTETCRGLFIVWRGSYPQYKYSVYGGNMGYLMYEEFNSEKEAKEWVQNYHNNCELEQERLTNAQTTKANNNNGASYEA